MAIQTKNPFNNKVLKTFEELSEAQLETKIATAHKAYASWKNASVKTKSALLSKVSELMLERKEELAKLITIEMGKLFSQSITEIEMCASVYQYYADNAEAFLKDRPLHPSDGKAFIRYTPTGIVLGVEPWNFPFNQVGRITAPNVVAGNVIMIKHASNVPQCAQMMEQLFRDAGAPDGVFTNLFLSGDRIAKLAADDRIAGLSLTGSEKAGSSLAEAAGKNLKKSVLELGGSDAFIILDDADIDLAVEKAVLGRFNNMGQSCTSAKRIIAVAEVADEFLEKFKAKITGLKAGDPLDEDTEIAPMVSEEAVKTLSKQVDETVQAGATIVIGGKRIDREGAFYEFTILTDIPKDSVAYREELFGPVASFYKVKDESEAIELANATHFGLGGSVFSKDIDRAINVASQIDTGMVFINQQTSSRPDLPFGGTKRSGYGRELSELGIEEFINKKVIRIGEED